MDRPEDWADYEDQWQELNPKVLQAQMVVELQRIRVLLESALEGETGDSQASESEPMCECLRCGYTGTEAEVDRHVESAHNAPPGMADELSKRGDE